MADKQPATKPPRQNKSPALKKVEEDAVRITKERIAEHKKKVEAAEKSEKAKK